MAACGTRSGYVGGCRCDPCRRAHNDAQTLWRNTGSTTAARRIFRYATLPPTEDWLDQAACAGHDPNQWYVTDRIGRTYSYAREICITCPVQAECLEWALKAHEYFGMWGGLTPDERRRLARRRAS